MQKALAPGQAAPRTKLARQDRERLVARLIQGMQQTTVNIAATPGRTSALVAAIASLGGTVRYRADEVEYVSATLATSAVDVLSRSPDVEAISLDASLIYWMLPTRADTALWPITALTPMVRRRPLDSLRSPKAPGPTTPAVNPYLPVGDIGAPQFIAQHPTFDGRGVGIALLDDGIPPDVLNPVLGKALSLDGHDQPKLGGVICALDPGTVTDTSSIIGRVSMTRNVTTAESRFVIDGRSYIAPHPGQFRFGAVNTPGFVRVLRLADADSGGSLDVLWDERGDTAWVDANHDASFANEVPLPGGSRGGAVAVVGMDNLRTPNRESVGILVCTDATHHVLELYPAVGAHGSAMAGAAVGRALFGGAAQGAAPGAQMIATVWNSYTGTFYNMLEAPIAAARDPHVDILAMAEGGGGDMNAGQSTHSVILNRLSRLYRKPILQASGNVGPGLNTVEELSAGNEVISVGGYANATTLFATAGILARGKEFPSLWASHGPSEAGGMKPDVVAPAHLVSAGTAIKGFDENGSFSGIYSLSPLYQATTGTSFAAPMAAGAVGLLISAAKQAGIPYDARRLHWALKASARFIPGYQADRQGSGLIDVPAAWDLLRTAPEIPVIESRAPVHTVLSADLKTPNEGVGIYEREGWRSGARGTRFITFTRLTGPDSVVHYGLRWSGNDGTFTAAPSIALPRGVAVSLAVHIQLRSAGVHSAILNVDALNGTPAIYQVMNTVVAAEQFTAARAYQIHHVVTIAYPGYQSYFVHVPHGVRALQVDMAVTHGTVYMRVVNPAGSEMEQYGLPRSTAAMWHPGGHWTKTFPNPQSGVWEIIVDNDDFHTGPRDGGDEAAQCDLTIAVAKVGIGGDLDWPIHRPVVGEQYQTTVLLVNHFAPFVGGAITTPLGSERTDRIIVTQAAGPKVYELAVPEGTSSIRVRIAAVGQQAAGDDVDLYLYDCTREVLDLVNPPARCVVQAASTGAGVSEEVFFAQPRAGRWKVVVDPVRVATGSIALKYRDAFFNSRFGAVTPIDTSALRPSGARWTVPARVVVDSLPAGPRHLVWDLSVVRAQPDVVAHSFARGYKRTYDVSQWIRGDVIWRVPLTVPPW